MGKNHTIIKSKTAGEKLFLVNKYNNNTHLKAILKNSHYQYLKPYVRQRMRVKYVERLI